MIKNIKKCLFLLIVGISAASSPAMALLQIVAAENVYGNVAKELGGPYVTVTNILNNPTQDTHLFSINPSTAKIAAKADIIVYNGADYDPWMKSLLAVNASSQRTVLVVAQLIGAKAGDNPHIWYKPETIPLFAQNMVALLSRLDPEHQSYFKEQLRQFELRYQAIYDKVKKLKEHFYHTPVIATEPIFNYMAESIGLTMHGIPLQLNIMNDIPPSISQIKQFEQDLTDHAVRVFIYNKQVSNPLTKRLHNIADKEKIPSVGVTEMLPPDTNYVDWMVEQLMQLEMALAVKKDVGNESAQPS